jgi:hypothetical protein
MPERKTPSQIKNSIQDDVRELTQIEQFGLIQHDLGSRGAYDATDKIGNRYELKTTSRDAVATSRDAGMRHIERWRNEYWVISFWDRDANTLGESYFLTPENMEEWISSIEFKILERLNLMDKIKNMIKANVSKYELELFDRCTERAGTLNAPQIPMKYVRQNGQLIRTKKDLKKLVEQNPLKQYIPKQNNTLLNFFIQD